MKLLSHPNDDIQRQATQALSNLAMNTENQKQIQVIWYYFYMYLPFDFMLIVHVLCYISVQ